MGIYQFVVGFTILPYEINLNIFPYYIVFGWGEGNSMHVKDSVKAHVYNTVVARVMYIIIWSTQHGKKKFQPSHH